MASIKSDAAGFLLGEPVKSLTRAGGGKSEVLLSGILGEVRAIRQAVSPVARGGSSRAAELATIARFTPAVPTGRLKGEARAATTAQPGTGRRSPGWVGREVAQPTQRDERGRFTKKATTGDGATATASPSGPTGATFGVHRGLGDRIAGAINGAGMEEADPAVKAFSEIAQPLARGYSMLSGGDRAERQKTGWFRKIFGELRMFRAEETGFSKAAGKSLKALEEKPEAVADGSGSGGIKGVLDGIKTALPRVAMVLGGLAAAMAPLLAMLKVTQWAADTSQDKERVDALNEGAAKPAKEALQAVGIDSDKRVEERRADTIEKRDGEYAKEAAAKVAFKAPPGVKEGTTEYNDAFYRDQQDKEAAAAEQAKKGPLRRGWESVKGSIVGAAQRAGIDPGVLAKIANFESGFNPDAAPIAKNAAKNRVRQYDGRMAISSAHGLGQFTDDTWLGTLRKHGAKYGVSNAGGLTKDQAAKLRGDKDLQAAMLAEFTKENIEKGRAIGGKDDDANVYALHNLGSGDGPKLLSAMKSNPSMSVRDALMQGAKTDKQRARIEQVIAGNRSLYGDGSGSVKDAYDRMGKVMRNGESFAIRAREASRTPVMASMPKAPTIRAPSIPAAADTQPVTVPLSSSSKPQVVTVAQAPADVGQDLRDRRIAHIATGGINGY